MTEIGNVTVRVDAVITDEQYHEAMGAVRAANERMDLLEAENARLHEYVTKLEQANIALDSDNTELRNDTKDMQMIVGDNHKLRELVKQMYPMAKAFLQMGVQMGLNDSLSYDWQVQLFGLGIEVEE